MPDTINIWEEAEMEDKGATTGGTWSYVGTITPAPTAPVTYNGTADFTGLTTAGDYEFKYEVTSGGVTTSNIYTVAYDIYDTRTNDTCSTPINIVTFPGYPFLVEVEDNLAAACPGCESPTDSGTAIPSEWGSGAPFRDLWYRAHLSANDEIKFIVVTIDGTPYSNGITNPVVELYLDNIGTACGSLTPVVASRGAGKTVVTGIAVPSGVQRMLTIRVSAPDGDEGMFSIKIEN